MNTSPWRAAVPLVATICLAAPLAATPAHAATPRPTQTYLRTLQPWSSTGKLLVKAPIRTAPRGSQCTSSNLTGRKDAYRCYIGSWVMDPAFKSPRANLFAVADENAHWTVYRVGTSSQDTPGPASIVRLKLANGATCMASSGAGPMPVKGYSGWVGWCVGGPYKQEAFWRAKDGTERQKNYPLVLVKGSRTLYAAPVELNGRVTLQPVTYAWR